MKSVILCMLGIFFVISAAIADGATPSEMGFIDKYFSSSKTVNCKPKSWFSGYSKDTTFAFSRSYPYILVLDYTRGLPGEKSRINEIFHIVKIANRSKGQIVGQFYSPSIKAINKEMGANVNPLTGSFLISSDGFGEITVATHKYGKSSTTNFSCEFDLDELLY